MTNSILQNINSLNVTETSNIKWNDLSNDINSFEIDPTQKDIGWIKNPTTMGITDPNTAIKSNEVKKNIQGYQEYYNALISGKSQATTIQNNNQPLGNREFIKPTNIKCMDNDGNIQDRYYIVDGMAYYNGDSVNNGLVRSAYQTLQDITDLSNNAGKIITEPTTYSDNTCVMVNLIKDGNGNKESGYISTNEYNIWKKKNPSIFSENFSILSQEPLHNSNTVYGFNHLNNFGKYDFQCSNKNIDINIDIFMENNKKNEENNDEEEEIMNQTGLVIKDDLITSFFLGSITVLGLYVVFRLLNNKK